MDLDQMFREFTSLLEKHHVEYVIVGTYAMAAHGCSRYTDDIDFFVRPDIQNGKRLYAALNEFGLGSAVLEPEKLGVPGYMLQLGHPPFRMDFLFRISGVEFKEAWDSHLEVEVDGLKLNVISREMFIKNKLASGRPKDLGDVSVITTKSEYRERTRKKE